MIHFNFIPTVYDDNEPSSDFRSDHKDFAGLGRKGFFVEY